MKRNFVCFIALTLAFALGFVSSGMYSQQTTLAHVLSSSLTKIDDLPDTNFESNNNEEVNCQKLKFFKNVNVKTIDWIQEMVIDCLDSNQPTKLTMITPGGDIDPAHAFFDAVMAHPNRGQFTTVATGEVASAGVIIFLAGEKRLVTPHSIILIHMISKYLEGLYDFLEVQELYENIKVAQYHSANIFARRSGQSQEVALKAMLRGTSYTAQEALDIGMATSIVSDSGS